MTALEDGALVALYALNVRLWCSSTVSTATWPRPWAAWSGDPGSDRLRRQCFWALRYRGPSIFKSLYQFLEFTAFDFHRSGHIYSNTPLFSSKYSRAKSCSVMLLSHLSATNFVDRAAAGQFWFAKPQAFTSTVSPPQRSACFVQGCGTQLGDRSLG